MASSTPLTLRSRNSTNKKNAGEKAATAGLGETQKVDGGAPAKILKEGMDDGNAGAAGSGAPNSASATIGTSQLEKKWKHAPDFGITTPKRNAATLADFGKAIASHLDDAGTIKKGTYLYVPDSNVFFNPNTNLVVVLDKNRNFVTGWKLLPGTPQIEKYIKDGILI